MDVTDLAPDPATLSSDEAAQASLAALHQRVTRADPETLRLIFTEARTLNGFDDRPIPEATLRAVFDLMKWGPTSANGEPGRFVFLVTRAAKERLRPALSPGNRDKTMAAPVVAIVAYDTEYWKLLPRLFPHKDMTGPFRRNPQAGEINGFRNGTLQGAYLIIAARALGLDCGPMSGFDNAGVDAEFFADGKIKSNFLCNLGYADHSQLMPRNPRLSFDEACQVL